MLVLVLVSRVFAKDGKPNPVHLFDCGSAWENLALQATAMGFVAHGMQGFDFDRAAHDLRVPEDFAVAAMFALGRPGDPDQLPEKLREVEKPSQRRPVRESNLRRALRFRSHGAVRADSGRFLLGQFWRGCGTIQWLLLTRDWQYRRAA